MAWGLNDLALVYGDQGFVPMAYRIRTADCDLPVPGGPCLAHTNKSLAQTNKSGDAVRATKRA